MDAPPMTPESNDAQSARSHAAHGSADLHACRWATRTKGRKPFDEPRWTKWHASTDGCRTLCGLVIIIATEAAFTPDTDDEMSRVDCPRCCRKLNPPNDEAQRGRDAEA